MRRQKGILYLLLLSFLFISCSKPKTAGGRYYVDDYITYALAPGTTPLVAVNKLNYKKLDDFKGGNLARITGTEGSYIWLKIEFDVPDYLKYRPLGFVIPYLHFSEVAYLNGNFIGAHGTLPPNAYSAMYAAHFYNLPNELMKWGGTNTILLKVWAQGQASITEGTFIAPYDVAKNSANIIDFLHAHIYLLFESSLVIVAIVMFLVARGLGKKGRYFKIFSYLTLVTMPFIAFFFVGEIPVYQLLGISQLTLYKVLMCVPSYWIIFFITSFILAFLEIQQPKGMVITRVIVTGLASIITFAMPTYNSLMKSCPYFLAMIIFHGFIAFFFVIIGFIERRKRMKAVIIIHCLLPLLVTMTADIILRNVLLNINHSYLAVHGWFLTIVLFTVYMSQQYTKMSAENQRLNESLAEEVEIKTVDLTFANQRLEMEMQNASRDLDMASAVQKKFFPPTEYFIDGWEMAVCYEPMSKISGDLYDYYTDGNKLVGLGLFDASGHGVSASLLVMLAKSIIFRCFNRSRVKNQTLATALEDINEILKKEKGDVQNYMTGLLFRVNDFDANDRCLIELASAGHPYPIFYSESKQKLVKVTHDELQDQYGALGIQGVEVSFPNIDLDVGLGDVLVCFTDGLNEATNEDMEEFGISKVEEILTQYHNENASEIRNRIKEAVYNHIASNPRSDDITFIVFKRVPRWESE